MFLLSTVQAQRDSAHLAERSTCYDDVLELMSIIEPIYAISKNARQRGR